MDGVIGIVFNDRRDQILLVKRRDVPVWVLPGGGIEKGETPEKAIVREVFEETGYKTGVLRKVAEYTHTKSGRKSLVYECEILSGKARTSDESKAVRFFSIGHLQDKIYPLHSGWIQDGLTNQKKVIRASYVGVTSAMLLRQLFSHPVVVFRYLLVKIGLRINT
ncbi:hypothetical protein A3A14_00445 [Candidatus Daviesbacteria bacterium RIFCSPLOWO2_01_FULL_43_38]|uniref:Nudix hydrolase domain-containing protein n=1 Tax=Candidatus Daviesbacteria bacterium RIFCSPHIGHO2_12_FULL_43_11 TaxID=1797780 RepID=A0A1F5K825_9BACT|nr:MAG: hypothetical protein A2874_02630 [Candidatus Daviesbacteria bacterium RIFCSPHIGHO2_01_FULL_43_17]OGE37087.1 MAG: hypothetical protein A3E45_02235 [Candidatus Daviesbacteria bacterium RIFCSPHIGHO2_12_FULL_43_11]OGE64000.1 MAG: hypothetical protein A3A14_00445 [Candidatus Daviesbacteria bacterium RIFCSPLOWO2_01_FULL_43_38]